MQTGLSTNLINQLHQILQQESVSRLCPPEAPAATELGKLDKQTLLEWSQKCKEAINQWCCSPRDYEATPSALSLTTRDSRLPPLVCALNLPSPTQCFYQTMLISALRSSLEMAGASSRIGCRKYAMQPIFFHKYLGKSQDESRRSIWDVLEMFWGKERREALQNCTFGDPNLIHPESKNLLNRLYNMITLSPDLHALWGLGEFILEPLMAEGTTFELKLRFQWILDH